MRFVGVDRALPVIDAEPDRPPEVRGEVSPVVLGDVVRAEFGQPENFMRRGAIRFLKKAMLQSRMLTVEPLSPFRIAAQGAVDVQKPLHAFGRFDPGFVQSVPLGRRFDRATQQAIGNGTDVRRPWPLASGFDPLAHGLVDHDRRQVGKRGFPFLGHDLGR